MQYVGVTKSTNIMVHNGAVTCILLHMLQTVTVLQTLQ